MNSGPRLICIPSTDPAFAAHARDLLETILESDPETALATRRARQRFARRLADMYPTAVVRERHPLAKVWPEDGPVWYAIRRDYSSRLAAKIDIPAERKHVFDVYVKRMPEWQVAVDLRRLHKRPTTVGAEYAISYNFMGRTLEGRLRIVGASPPRAVRVEATGMGVDVWYVTTFRSIPNGTRVEVQGDYNLPSRLIPAAVGRLIVERRIADDIERAHAALRALCLGTQPADYAPAELAPAEHAPAEHAPAELAPAEYAPAEHASAEHAAADPARVDLAPELATA